MSDDAADGLPSTKPYLIRAIYDWCADNGFAPYLAVRVDPYTRVPMSHVRNGEIVLNLSIDAVRNLQLGNDAITCGARFGGTPYEIVVPIGAVIGIFARENGQGLVFQAEEARRPQAAADTDGDEPEGGGSPPGGKTHLRVVK